MTSKTRATAYALGAAIIALTAYYVGATVDEIALWEALLAAAIPFIDLIVSTVKTWPRRSDADG